MRSLDCRCRVFPLVIGLVLFAAELWAQDQPVSALFAVLDVNQDGLLDYAEATAGAQGEALILPHFLFYESDVNDDDLLTQAEYVGVVKGRIPPVAQDFLRHDVDHSSDLSWTEFKQWYGVESLPRLRRDFQVVDFDHNERLSLLEFQALPAGPIDGRGPVPDPVQQWAVQRWKAVLTASDKNSDGQLSREEWPERPLGDWGPLARMSQGQWDADGDGMVTSEEGQRLVDIAYGIARPDGEALRLPSGIMVDLVAIRILDKNSDGVVSREEFVSGYWAGARNAELFAGIDTDRDGRATIAEFRRDPNLTVDAVGTFLWMDKNFDGKLDRAELIATAAPWRKNLAERLIPAFDDDKDGGLSLNEYRMSPFANPGTDWYFTRRDTDLDGMLSFAEFYLERSPEFVGLHHEIYNRLDLNHDGQLTIDEFDFVIDMNGITPTVLFDLLDRDHNRRVTAEELFAKREPTAAEPQAMARYLRLRQYHMDWFKSADVDRDGLLTYDEFKAQVASFNPATYEKFVELDENGDDRLKYEEYIRPSVGTKSEALARTESTLYDLNDDGLLTFQEFRISPRASPSPRQRFTGLDVDGDGGLSLKEFLHIIPPPTDIARRDFLLFDKDGNGSLSFEEYSSASTPWKREPMDDPLVSVVDAIVAALDKALGDWNRHPEKSVNAAGFVKAFKQRFANVMPQINLLEADPDNSGAITRNEARRFLEIQLGVRRPKGELLREPNGRVVNYLLYLHVDQNRNDKLERSEFMERSYAGDRGEEEFNAANLNGDDSLSFEEWCLIPTRGMADPVMEFRTMDKNLDAFLSRDELLAGTPEWKLNLAKSVFPSFDLNRDGRLSLNEYRLTMQANPVVSWHTQIVDPDGDGTLSLNDFKFDSPFFPLLRLMYFHCLDVNGNGKLEVSEFDFKTKIPDEFFTLNEDGSGWKPFFKFEGHPACGSPTVSPDGKSLAFDAWPQGPQSGSVVYVMDINGGKPREICPGMMPSWSADGTKLACSRSGVWMTDLEGLNPKQIAQGWGIQCAPDGTRVAFTVGNTSLITHNLESGEFITIFDGNASGYQQIFWNMAWSPDCQRLCFKGQKPDGTQEVCLINTTGEQPMLKVLYSSKTHINADFAWHPRGHRIVFAAFSPERKLTQLFDVDPDGNQPPNLVPGQSETLNNTDACWTPDGKRLIVISGDY